MARRRLTPLGMAADTPEAPPPPVARIAADAAGHAALEDLADELRRNREEGRLILELPLDAIEADHLLRDRLHLDPEEMASLKDSLGARGQQMPVEVVEQAPGRYGLISGARRLAALRSLAAEGKGPGTVRAILRRYDEAPAAYLAMVEENEIRAGLSFYERGRLAHEAARLGVFPDAAAAVRALFIHAPPSRRSKILAFVALHERLSDVLRFPEAIPEKLGLALHRALGEPEGEARLRAALAGATPSPQSAASERALLEAALRSPGREKGDAPPSDEPVRLLGRPGRAVLTGPGVDEAFLTALTDWIAAR